MKNSYTLLKYLFHLKNKLQFNYIVFCFVSIFGFFLNNVNAQVSTYSFTEVLSTYTPLTAPTNIAYASPWDNHTTGAASLAPIGFTFSFEGLPYTDCYVSPNGFITFGATQPALNNFLPLSSINTYTGAICALGIDLVSNGFDIEYKTLGTAPNRVFVIQWKDVVRNSEAGNINFQIRLLETTNNIEIVYGACNPTTVTLTNPQVGLRGSTNVFAQGNVNNLLKIITTGNWFGNSFNPGNSNASFLRLNNVSYPNLGLKYTWTPPLPCSTPANQPTSLILGGTSVNTTSFVGNSFTAATSNPTSYLILRSTDPTPPSAALFPNRTFFAINDIIGGVYTVLSNNNSTTFTQTGLSPNTTYYYWILSMNDKCFGSPYYNTTSILAGNQTTCSIPTVALAATNINGNGFDANWNAVAGATNYAIDIATDSGFTALVPGYSNLSVGNVTTFTVTGLSSLSTYYYRIKNVGIGCVINSNTITVSTPCGYYNVPYYQNFDTTTIPSLPVCFNIANNNGDGVQWNTTNSNAASAPNVIRLNKTLSTQANDWFFIPGLNLTGGVSYRLFFRYNTNSGSTFSENLRVRFGTAPTEVGMSNTIIDLPNIVNTIYQIASVDFTPVTSGVYYVGFQGYSFVNQNYILVDDISVTLSPTCFEPSNLIVSSTGISTATITWTASSPVPSNGYQYYYSTSNTTPASSVTPTGSVGAGITTVNLTGLASSTSYFIWVRGNCGGSTSIWSLVQVFSTDCLSPVVTSSTSATRCGTGTAILSATPNAGSAIRWFSSIASTTSLGFGNNFTTPILNSTTTYYAQASAVGGNVSTGPISPAAQGGSISVETATTYVNFNVSANSTLQSFDIYPIASGQSGQFVIRNATNVILATYPFTTTFVGGNTPQTLAIGYALTPGNYSILIDIMPSSGLSLNVSNVVYPYSSSVSSITSNGYDNNYYFYFYNWRFSTQCLSPKVPVTATVTAPPALSFSQASQIFCEGEGSSLITLSGAASYNWFSWSPPAGVTGSVAAGFVFNPSVSTTYTLTAAQTSGSQCVKYLTFNAVVNAAPSSININPSAVTICENSIQAISSSLGSSTEVTFYTENFEGPTNSFTTTNTSGGGIPANPAWTLRDSPYSYASPFWVNTFSSNDNSQFYFSIADSGGSGSFTSTTLESPAISLVGYTTANINFYHYLRYVSSDVVLIQVSTNNGTSWTTVQQYFATQSAAAGTTNFKNSIVNLNAYAGLPSVKVRFKYESNWGYGWAIDNVTFRGTLALAVNWSPATELYTDVAATTPYVLGNAIGTVYAKPTATRTYTGTVVGGNGCTASSTSTITVENQAVLGTMSASQTLCTGGTPASITISGYTGNIIRWEFADDSAFTTSVTSIANTTATLAAAQMGSFTTIRYFRVVLVNGVCAPVFTVPVSVSYPSTTWNGTVWSNGLPTASTRVTFLFSGTYNVTAPMSACSVRILSGDVVVNSGISLTVDGIVDVSAGSLTFENNASLVQVQNTANIGSITYKRDAKPMFKYDYTYWASPVATQNIRSFSPTTLLDKYFYWNTGIFNWSTIYAFTNPGPYNTTMTPGIGYIMRAPDGGVPLFDLTTRRVFNGVFTGVPNNGTISVPIVVSGVNKKNFIGNPYPSAINAVSFIMDAQNSTAVDGTIYLWTHNTPVTALVYNTNDFATLNIAGGVGTGVASPGINNSIPGNFIAAGQGFFINGKTATSVAYFRNSMRSASNSQFFRLNENTSLEENYLGDHHRFWLEIINADNVYKQALIGYFQNATSGYDSGYDGKLMNEASTVNLYTFLEDDKLSIQGKGLPFQQEDTFPLGYSTNASGSLTIKKIAQDGIFTTQHVYLEDKDLNIIHNLSQSDYSFNSAQGTFDNRFVIRFTSNVLGINDPVFNDNALLVFKKNEDINIESMNIVMDRIQIYDMRGRLIASKNDVNNTKYSFTNLNIAQQVLLVKVTDVDGIEVTKKIIY